MARVCAWGRLHARITRNPRLFPSVASWVLESHSSIIRDHVGIKWPVCEATSVQHVGKWLSHCCHDRPMERCREGGRVKG
jgi:hypothetical protein